MVSELVKNLFLLKDMDQNSTHMVAASKVSMLKPGEYEIWRIRIEQYIQMIDYALWEVIENGATLPKTKIMEGVMTKMPITTAKEKATKRLEVKARSSLLMGIPYEHQLKFNSIKDDKKLLEAVEKRFGGNEATKKTKRNLLKQQYENFTTPSSKMLDQTFDRLQKLVKWNTHVVVWRNKADLDTMSMDDLYNNLQVYEPEVKGMSSSSSSTQIMAFVDATMHKRAHCARECRSPRNQDNKNKESSRRSVPVETSTSTALVSCDGLGGYDWSDQAKEWPNYALVTFSSSNLDSELIECQIVDNCKKGLGYENYNAVPPPYTRNFMPPTPDLSFTGFDEFVNNPLGENYKAMSSEEEPKVVRKNDDAWNISYLIDYEEIDRGYVAFGGNPKGGKITGKGLFVSRSIETEFPATILNDSLTSNETPSCEPTVSSLNDEIDFRTSFDEFNDEDYMVVFDKNSFSYKIFSTNDLKKDSENDNEKVNKPLFPSPEPTVSCLNDLDFFKDFENEFPAIVYNDALTY
ncbi:hypothetical protein Tco_0444857 [Tanacetum coccineum]